MAILFCIFFFTYSKSFGQFCFVQEMVQHGIEIAWAGLVTSLTNDVRFTGTRPRNLVACLANGPAHITVAGSTASVNVTQTIKPMLQVTKYINLHMLIFPYNERGCLKKIYNKIFFSIKQPKFLLQKLQ